MTVTIPARPTTYKGIRMRSRLEASVAQWMDDNGWQWAYEPRAYAGSGGQYLPDFEILAIDGIDIFRPYFLEVRPTLERAYEAMRQMQIILESEPRATLCISIWPLDLQIALPPGARTWRFL